MAIVKGFFFDLDGTLVDTYQADFLAYRDAISAVTGASISDEQFAKTHGQEMRQKLKSFNLKLSTEEIANIAEHKKQYYGRYIDQTKPLKELIGFLRYVSNGHTTVLVTTAKAQNAKLVLEAHGLTKFFTHTVFGDEVQYSKPHPQAYKLALAKCGLRPKEVIAFEDSDSGITSATKAGIVVVKVGNHTT
jgi:HAD superfamily hydrolase (TIGR01509 family)